MDVHDLQQGGIGHQRSLVGIVVGPFLPAAKRSTRQGREQLIVERVKERLGQGTPEGGYEADQRMSREEALRSYTLDAAFGEFAEDVKGSIEVGKLADFTVFTNDLMSIPEDEILLTEVAMTIFNGEIVFEKAN